MTPDLCEQLIIFSFDSLQDIIKERKKFNNDWVGSAHDFFAPLLECLKRLVRYGFYSCGLHIFII